MNRRLLACGAWLLMGATVSWAQLESRVTLAAAGWTISADPESGTLHMTHEQLGELMRQVRLHAREAKGPRPLTNWTVERRAPNQLFVKTIKPQAGWLFELRPNLLKISTTLHDAVITAQLPAPTNRIPARLLDPLAARGRNAIFSTDVFCRSELAIHAASPSGSSQAAQLAA
jgi:hypothetical protein